MARMRRSWWQAAALSGTVVAVVALAPGMASARPDTGRAAAGHSAGQLGVHRAAAQNDPPGQPGPVLRQVATVAFPAPAKPSASFDISWMDPVTQTYYLADRTNNGVDAVNASSDSFESVIGAGDFTGNGTTATAAQVSACGAHGTGGPNGVLSLDVGGVRQVWAGNGVDATSPVSTVKVFNLTAPGSGTLAATVSTAGRCRADELAYDPADHLVAIANDLDTPPYVSFISVQPNPAQDKVVGTIKFPAAIDGIEQSGWDPANGMFYVNIPQVPDSGGTWHGEVAVINPRTMSVTRAFTVPGCSPGGMAIDAASQDILLGCSGDAISGDTVAGVTYRPSRAVSLIISARDGHVVSTFHQVGGSDEVWLDPVTRMYYLAADSMTSNGQSSGYATPVLGVIAAGSHGFQGEGGRWLGNFPAVAQAHSVAANPVNGQVFVPIPGYGIAVFAAASR
jgi:hypothetical protein